MVTINRMLRCIGGPCDGKVVEVPFYENGLFPPDSLAVLTRNTPIEFANIYQTDPALPTEAHIQRVIYIPCRISRHGRANIYYLVPHGNDEFETLRRHLMPPSL